LLLLYSNFKLPPPQTPSLIARSLLCDLRVGAQLLIFHGPEPTVSCRHSSVMWVVGHTSPTYCRYLHGV